MSTVIRCEYCGADEWRTANTIRKKNGIFRRKKCMKCDAVMPTKEVPCGPQRMGPKTAEILKIGNVSGGDC